jgi:hypothetical protein
MKVIVELVVRVKLDIYVFIHQTHASFIVMSIISSLNTG